MSHYTCLIIGPNPEEQLKPFDKNLKIEFEDKTEENRKEYETEKVDEFYCSSHSSWGQQIPKELFEELKKSKVGRILPYEVKKLDLMAYLKRGNKYRGYYALKNNKRCKGDVWFEVEEVVSTTHPDEDVCFEGQVKIRKIAPPKKIALKDKYPVYDDYLKDWHGIKDVTRQGYDYNPKAKWDWYQLGGRWTGFFKLKSNGKGNVGKPGLMTGHPKSGTADQACKKDIDFEAMKRERFEESSQTYDNFEAATKAGTLKPGEGYWEYGVENVGKDAKHYMAENREQYLKRHAHLGTFAVLKDGEWYEKGEMGWWGCVSNEKDIDEWNNQFDKLLEELPDETLLSIYDCHI